MTELRDSHEIWGALDATKELLSGLVVGALNSLLGNLMAVGEICTPTLVVFFFPFPSITDNSSRSVLLYIPQFRNCSRPSAVRELVSINKTLPTQNYFPVEVEDEYWQT